MGASMSSSYLYKMVAIVEIICSSVIAIYGVNTFFIFHGMDEGFQEKKEMIQYSSIVAVIQSVLTLLATFLLIGCHHSTLRQEIRSVEEAAADPSSEKNRPSQIGHQYSLRRKAIAPTWTAWTLISIACLLFVFIGPLDYCIQAESDLEKLRSLTFRDGAYETIDNKRLGVCYSEAPELAPMRSSLKDLYSFSVISMLFKILFVIMVHRNWRSELRHAKKIVIYVEGPDSSNNIDNEMVGEGEVPSSPTKDNDTEDPKGTPIISGQPGSGGGGDATQEGSQLLGAGGGVEGPDENGAKAKGTKIELVAEKRKQ